MPFLQAAKARLYASIQQYAPALATGGHRFARSPMGVWSHYRLGMYQAVAGLPVYSHHANAQFARAASLTAQGEAEKAEAVARSLLESGLLGRREPAFIQAIAAFSPPLAESLCDSARLPEGSFLPAALALRLGQVDVAETRLSAYLNAVTQPDPEAVLVESNLKAQSTKQQGAYLNRFLASHGLGEVQPVDAAAPMGVMNLATASVEQAGPLSEGPLVSVLMTTYCSGARAVRAIESLLAQHHRQLEIIVVDDASSDNTFEMLQACAEHDSRVRCYQLPKNVGTYVAKTYGLQRANGEFITCHDSDDWSHPEKISRQLAPMLASRKVIATTSRWVRLSDDGQFFVRQAAPFTRLNPSSPLFRREVIEQMGGWDLVRTGADSEFLARLKLYFGKRAVKGLTLPLAFGAHRDDSLMTAKETGHQENAVSPQRLAYWESWSRWHIHQLRNRQPLRVAPTGVERAFAAPESIQVHQEDIQALLVDNG